jgi:hypothetical protein
VKPFVGIQIGAISFVDEGTGPVLDFLKEKAEVDAVFVATQAFDRGVAGRQVPGRPHPGHGPLDLGDIHLGGAYFEQHEEYYRGTTLGPYSAPDLETRNADVLSEVVPGAHERGMGAYVFLLENTHSGLTRHVPGWSAVLQEDAWGRADPYTCFRNPDYIAWWRAIVEDQVKSYDIDGILWGSERNGPLGNVLGDGGFARDGNPYCFCRWCRAAGHAKGIDPDRAREGYRELFKLTHGEAARSGDSRFVRFLAMLGRYPEIGMWDTLWHEGFEDFQARLYGQAKFIRPELQVGWHIWHHNSFSPLYRAQIDYSRRAEYSDFVKPVLYNNCAGYRLLSHIENVAQTLFEGVGLQTIYELYRGVLGYNETPRVEDLPAVGLSPDYVRRETKRTVDAVSGRAAVYPGLDVGVPTPDYVKQTGPDDIRASIRAAIDGGAEGIVLSRKYSEMTHANLAAAGEEIRSLS